MFQLRMVVVLEYCILMRTIDCSIRVYYELFSAKACISITLEIITTCLLDAIFAKVSLQEPHSKTKP